MNYYRICPNCGKGTIGRYATDDSLCGECSDNSSTTDKLSVEKIQEIRVAELKDFSRKILQGELKNQKPQEQLNTAKKALTESEKMYQKQMDRFLNSEMNESARSHCESQLKLLFPAHKAFEALAAIGAAMDNKRISEIGDEEMIKQDAQFGLMHYLQLEGMMSKEKCQTCGKDFEVNHDFFSMLYPFCSIECWDNYTKYEGSGDE